MDDGSVTTQLRCNRCGQPVPPGDNFCTGCGAPVFPETERRPLFADEVEGPSTRRVAAAPPPTPPAAPTTGPGPARRRRGGWLLALLLLVVAGGAGYLLGHRGEDAGTASPGGSTTAGATSGATSPAAPSGTDSPSASGTPEAQPQDQLQQIARQDDARVRRLVGSWVPQLAALTPGAGGDASWSQALLHYRHLKDSYPTALILDTGDWPHSYERGGMYAIVVPRPAKSSAPALRWCRAHVPGSPQDCAAKLIDTSGSWADNFDMGKPGPG